MKKILIICIANYCRSPVAESMLKKMTHNKFCIQSAGIKPLNAFDMDPRSRKYLESRGYEVDIHKPSRATYDKIIQSNYVFVLESSLVIPIAKIAEYQQKNIKLLNFLNPSLMLDDPYQMKDYANYRKIMTNIEKSCLLISRHLIEEI